MQLLVHAAVMRDATIGNGVTVEVDRDPGVAANGTDQNESAWPTQPG